MDPTEVLDAEVVARDAEKRAAEAGAELRRATGIDDFRAGFVMGSGWADAAAEVGESAEDLVATDLPGFFRPTAEGHRSEIRVVRRPGGSAVVFMGRTHLYEGKGPHAVVHAVRTAIAAGCSVIVLTNAAGSLTDALPVGEPALITDHINFTARSPLVGADFVDLSDVYSPRLRAVCRQAVPSIGEGVYGGWYGPAFETPAEIRMMRAVGCDLVGMSTVLEAIAARALGAEVLGMSLVTNLAAGMTEEHLAHDKIIDIARAATPKLKPLLQALAEELLGPRA